VKHAKSEALAWYAPRGYDMGQEAAMQHYIDCPICDASNPLEDDAKVGDEIFCTYCSGGLRLRKNGDQLRAVED
jgi:hypothetical protein